MSFELKWRNGIAYLHGTLNGQRIRESLGTRDKEIAAHLKAQAEARLVRASIYGEDAEATFADAYLLYRKTGRDDRGYLTPILKKIGRSRLRDVTPAKVKAIARELYPGAKPQTWNRYVIVPTSAVINNAHQHGLCAPIRIRRFSPKDQKQRVAVTREWIDKFRNAAIDLYSSAEHENLGARLAAYALFMFTTAARPTEAIELTPDHLDLANKDGLSEPTKTGNRRRFYLTEEVAEELKRLPPRKLLWGRNAGELRVFGWADCKGPIEPWKATCRAAGLPYRSPYEAGRHSFATEAVTRQERNVVTAAKVGNWKDPSILLRNYAHPEHLEEFAEGVFGADLAQRKRKRLKIVGDSSD
jgi:integrase